MATQSTRRAGIGLRGHLFGKSVALMLLAIPGVALVCVETTAVALMLAGVGIPLTIGLLPAVRAYADVHRTWAGQELGEEIPRPYRPVPEGEGLLGQVRVAAQDPATWRDYLWLWVNSTAGWALSIVMTALFLSPIWYLVVLALWAGVPEVRGALSVFIAIDGTQPWHYAVVLVAAAGFAIAAWRWTPPLMHAHARLTRWLLAPSEREKLAERVEHLQESRADTVDSQAAEIRRIERDLHDGAQARLVALGMNLGMAEEIVDQDPARARDLLSEARLTTSQALNELRDLVRGMHPPVLSDRGLDGAVRAIALAVPLRVDVNSQLPGRFQPPVEAAAYFAVAETLTNAAKHGGGERAWVVMRHEDGRLRLEVGDNGKGGARTTTGGGLAGIERRLGAFDGTLEITSPAGGPTVLSMEIPCAPVTQPSP